MKLALLIHGFNVSNGGSGTTDKLRPLLEKAGYTVHELDYGWSFLGGVAACNGKMAKIIAELAPAEAHTVAFGHSNGCEILASAAKNGAEFDQLVFINPAVKNKVEIGDKIRRVHVFHAPGDTVVRLGRYVLPWKWGNMGATGYKGKDERVINYDMGAKVYGEKRVQGHSDVFKEEKFSLFGPMMVYAVESDIEISK